MKTTILTFLLIGLSCFASSALAENEHLECNLEIVSVEALPSGKIKLKIKNEGSSQASSAMFDILLIQNGEIVDTWAAGSPHDIMPETTTEISLKVSKSKQATEEKKSLSDFDSFKVKWKMAIMFNPEPK